MYLFGELKRAVGVALSILLVTILFASCTSRTPAPVEYRITPILEDVLRAEKRRPSTVRLTWTVRPGDTVSNIADRFGLTVDDIVAANRLNNPNDIAVGQTLLLSRASSASTVKAKSTLDSSSIESKGTAVAQIPTTFVWPARGRVIKRFGKQGNGLVSDGINIALETGAPILATASGEVIYVGYGVRGFGNLVMVRHDDNWISAYAHAEEILVARGKYVSQGETIARAGTTGLVKNPQLHFELRLGTKPTDPLAALPKVQG